MTIEIKIEGAEELVSRIQTIEQFKKVKAAVKQAGHHIQGVMRGYPVQNHGPNPLLRERSERGRRVRGFFFANKIGVPYSRTHGLAKSWTVKMDGLTATVGQNKPYAELVQSAAKQTRGHARSGWITETEAVRQEGATVVAYIRDALVREVGG